MTGAVDTARIVLDASAAANVVMRTGRAPALLTILERSQLVIAPTLFHSEMANTLWKYVCAGDIDKDTALDRYEEATGLVDAFEADERLVTEAQYEANKTVNHAKQEAEQGSEQTIIRLTDDRPFLQEIRYDLGRLDWVSVRFEPIFNPASAIFI